MSHLQSGYFYHIYNRGNNGENIFIEEKNYHYFMKLYEKYFSPIAELYAYCLLKNHFHFLIRFKEVKDQTEPDYSKIFSNFFNSYAKSINKAYNRTGSLFEKPFRRKIIDNERYLSNIINYIHFNPLKHNFCEDITDYPYSSYNNIISEKYDILSNPIKLIFGNKENFLELHKLYLDEKQIA
ncbi:MAG: hypothetical protein A2Y34_01130, partial [Spirochaetes bacterium GWC1_27_15]